MSAGTEEVPEQRNFLPCFLRQRRTKEKTEGETEREPIALWSQPPQTKMPKHMTRALEGSGRSRSLLQPEKSPRGTRSHRGGPLKAFEAKLA